jgi:pyruvate/2-oxoglutarate dehydrogenase complex dihydrolipoamide dehydrogenase (E3) component
MREYDAIVIGTGQAGPSLANRLTEAGMRVAVIERGRFGGTCVNTGCTPTKALVASAYAAQMVRRAAEYGVMIERGAVIDMKKVRARKNGISTRSSTGIERWLKDNPACTVYEGHARFTAPKQVAVGDQMLTAERIFINVGGRALVPSIPGLDQVNHLTNSTILELDFVPPHLIVVGGSYIGLEFAQIYRRFGSEVTVLEMAPRLIAREDEDTSAAVAEILHREGIEVRTGVRDLSVSKRNNAVSVAMRGDEGAHEVTGTHILIAVGRRPNTDDLGLDAAGIATDQRGFIQVDDELRTNVTGVWALGDCNGKGAFTHTAYNDFEIVAANLLDNDARRVSDRILSYNLYTDPPLGRIGMTEAEVRKSGKKALIATRPMANVSRAVEKGEAQGFMKILVDAETQQVLGASILGVGGDEVIHALLALMYAKAPYTVMQRAMFNHPTVSELLPTMLGSLKPLQR